MSMRLFKVIPTECPMSHQMHTGECVLLVDLHLLPEVVKRIELQPEWSKAVVAVLSLKSEGDIFSICEGSDMTVWVSTGTRAFSSGEIFPNAKFPNASFPYAMRDYPWNPSGSGLRYRYSPVPIFLVGPEMERELQKAARENNKQVGILC